LLSSNYKKAKEKYVDFAGQNSSVWSICRKNCDM
jgi:hypothetical protein